MIGLRTMRHEEGRAFLMHARAARLAQAVDPKVYERAVREESTLLGLR